MELVVLFPALICWAVVARWGAQKALLWVWLPCVFLLPSYFILRFPHMPPFHFADMAVLPLGVVVVATRWRRWRFAWMDLWVLLFGVSMALSEALSEQLSDGDWKRLLGAQMTTSDALAYKIGNGEFAVFAAIGAMFLPYVLGKLAVEDELAPQTRRAIVTCLVTCLSVVALLSVRDFLKGGSLWQDVFKHFFPGQEIVWPLQTRWGFGRIPGPYAHAILAGMMFMMGAVYWTWLIMVERGWGRRRLADFLPINLRTITLAAIVAGLLMTQSRGPWGGLALALLLVQLLKRMPVARAGLIFSAVLLVILAVSMGLGSKYTAGNYARVRNQEQASAIYRRQLLAAYTPVIQARPMFGWGFTSHPAPNGQMSIDNEFLWLAVTQGFVGLILFLLICVGVAIRLLLLAARPRSHEEQLLTYAHMATMTSLMLALITVYMGEQVGLMFFFLVGWIQGMKPAAVEQRVTPELKPRFRFRRILA